MSRKLLIAGVSVFIVWMVGDFVVHGVLLHADYAKLPQLFRPEADAQRYFPLMIVAHVLMAVAFAWIYVRGVEARPWLGQGLRYGAGIALLTAVPGYAIYYVVQPLPVDLVVKQIVFSSVLLLVLGAVVAFICRGARA